MNSSCGGHGRSSIEWGVKIKAFENLEKAHQPTIADNVSLSVTCVWSSWKKSHMIVFALEEENTNLKIRQL